MRAGKIPDDIAPGVFGILDGLQSDTGLRISTTATFLDWATLSVGRLSVEAICRLHAGACWSGLVADRTTPTADGRP